MKKRKFISIILLLIIFFNIISVKNTSQALTAGELKDKINYVYSQADFIDRSKEKWFFIENYDKYSGESCHGYANAVSLALFGSNQNRNFNDWVFTENVDELCVGDIIRYRNDYNGGSTNHTMVVINIIGDTVYITDANHDGYDGIRWGDAYSKSQLASMISGSLCWTDWGTWNKGYFRHYIYSNVKSLEDSFVPDGTKQDIGTNFVAYITPTSNLNLAAQTTGTGNGANVNLTTRNDNSENQKWYFKRQSDGSYSIKNMYSGNYLDIENSGNIDHENIQVWSGGAGNKQNWFVYSYNGGYRLVPRSSEKDLKAMDIGDDIKDGANLQLYHAVSNNNAWQTFLIIKDMGEKQDLGTEFTASIVPKSNSKLAVETTGTDNGSNVQLGTRDNEENQKWIFTRQSDGSYSIKNKNAGKYLDIYNTGDTNGENVQVWSGGTGDKQSWFIYLYNGGYRLVPRSSSADAKALDIGDSIKDGANLQINCLFSNDNAWQTFCIIKDMGEKQDLGTEFTASIVPKSNSKLALEVTGTGNGSNVQLGTKSNVDSQKWIFTRQSDGSYSIKNKNAEKYLDIYNTGYTNKENVQVWSGGTGDKQSWFIYLYNGGYRLVPRSSIQDFKGLDIDTSTDEIKEGANLQIYDNWSSTNDSQTFEIINDYKKGDINGDGKINIKDWNILYAYINETMTLSSEELQRADVNEDGKINVKDLNRLYEHITETNPLD